METVKIIIIIFHDNISHLSTPSGKKKEKKRRRKEEKEEEEERKKKCFKNTKKEDVSFKGKKERKQREKTANTHVEKHKHAPEICRGH